TLVSGPLEGAKLMNARQAFFDRVRQAVAHGNRPGAGLPVPQRGSVGYQGAGADPVERFCQEFKNAGGRPYIARSEDEVCQIIRELLEARAVRNVLLGQGGLIERMNLSDRLGKLGVELIRPDTLQGEDLRDAFFRADVGISNVAHLVAETGSVVMA